MTKTNFTAFAFIVSLIINAFLAGYVVSTTMHRHGPPPSPLERMEEALHTVSPSYQAEIKTIIKAHQQDLNHHMQDMAQTFDKITPILTAPTFDAGALENVHKDMAKYDNELKDSMLSMMVAIAKILPDDERIMFFTEMAPQPPRFRGPPPEFQP